MIIAGTDLTGTRNIERAASELTIRLPFFGYMMMGTAIKVVERGDIQTMATDGVHVFWSPKFAREEGAVILLFALLHEVIHIFLNHHMRCEGRNKRRWNRAIDIYTNMMCSELLAGPGGRWPIPSRFIQPEAWAKEMTAEQIYERLEKEDEAKAAKRKEEEEEAAANNGPPPGPYEEPEGGDELSNGTDMLDPEDGSGADAQMDEQWQAQFREDVTRAKVMSERTTTSRALPAAIYKRVLKLSRASLPWSTLVRGELTTLLGNDNISYAPPRMQYYPIILPRLCKQTERVLVVAVDVSTSMGDAFVQTCISNVQAAASRATKTIVITFDAVVREVYETTHPKEIFKRVHFQPGAHSRTSAIEMFAIAKLAKPSAVCVMTDGYIDLPPEPMPKTLFIIPEGGQVQPWGKTYVMEHPWR